MRVPHLLVATAALGIAVGCGQAGGASEADATPLPETVNCADRSQLTGQAVDARRRSAEVTGDRARIIAGGRANFLASLATMAQLKCRVSIAEADAMLEAALEAARGATATRSEYEAILRWMEADFLAGNAIAVLVGEG